MGGWAQFWGILNMYKHLITAAFCAGLFACNHAPRPVFEDNGYKEPAGSVTIMTYNVENLFDTEDDADRSDEAYLPLSKKDNELIRAACRAKNDKDYRKQECMEKDWSEDVLATKMRRLTDVLSQVRAGRGPDVLLLQEVENKNVLEIWRKNHLAKMNYNPAILIEGEDERGIDVGLMTRLEVVGEPKLHKIPFVANDNLKAEDISGTRGILETTLKMDDGSLLTVMVVHLPSQSNPTEMRKQSLEFVNNLKTKLPKDRAVLVGGDFNVSSDEEAKEDFFAKTMAKDWAVSHFVGCDGCDGTYFYNKDKAWNFLDVFLISKDLMESGKSPWQVSTKSIRIANKSIYQTNIYDSPAKFDQHRKDGVSDHWPMVMELVKRNVVVGEQ